MKDFDPFEPEPPQPLARWPVWALLSAAALAIGIIIFTVQMLRPMMDERLYARYRNLPEAHFLLPEDSMRHPALALASTRFNQKKYRAALENFEQDTSLFYAVPATFFKGICQLELQQMEPAEALLEPLVKGDTPWASEARFYAALSHLRRHDRPGAAEWLHSLGSDHPRHPEAETLLEKIGY